MDRLVSSARADRTTRPAGGDVLRRSRVLTRTVCLAAFVPVVLGFDLAGWVSSATSLVTTALGLGMVIFLHELGHFAAAKWCGVKVERFSIGFGPAIVSKTYGETEYWLCWLPLGGYVGMLGQDDMDASQMTDEEIAEDPRSYSAQSVPERMLIISAGVIMNIITGTMFFMIAYGAGVQQPTPYVGEVVLGSTAWERGIEVGDRFVSIDGAEINSFSDIIRGTALSRGELDLMIESRDGDSYRVQATPKETGRRRQLGVGSSLGLKVGGVGDEPSVFPGLPAADAGFLPNDVVIAVDGVLVNDYLDFRAELAKRRTQTVTVTVARFVDGEQRNVELSLAPHRRRELGFQVDSEAINSVVDGSVAAEEGIRVGDRLAKIDGQAVGVELDPLDLPSYFAERAGQSVTVTIAREEDGNLAESDLSLVPRESQPWLYPAKYAGSAMAIPSLGVTMPLIPTILKVEEGSVADEAGLDAKDALVSIKAGPVSDDADTIGGQAIEFDIAEVGWPFVVEQLPLLGDRDLELTVTDAASGELKTVTLPAVFEGDAWPSARGLMLYSDVQWVRADSFGEAFSMGLKQMKTSVADIYLTLSSLTVFGGSLSPLEFAGPFQIATMGYQVAKSGLPDFLIFLGFLSINLAVINFLPIPVLDGGHMVFLIWEGLTGRKPPKMIVEYATLIGFVFIVGLMLFVLGLDTSKFIGLVE